MVKLYRFTKSGAIVTVVSKPEMVLLGHHAVKAVSVKKLVDGKRMLVAVNALEPIDPHELTAYEQTKLSNGLLDGSLDRAISL